MILTNPSPLRSGIINPDPQEPGAILALMPSLVFAATRSSRRRALALWGACRAVLRGENQIARLPQDFGFAVPREALGPDIPGDDASAGVHGEYSEIRGALDDVAEEIAVFRCCFSGAPLHNLFLVPKGNQHPIPRKVRYL
jgi:hypothetical protein